MTTIPVLCFPPAGAGASFFHRWRGSSPLLEIVPVEVPGRERRFAEAPHTDLHALVAQLARELDAVTADASRVALFGHSFGAVLAYEVARALLARDPERDLALFVSGAAVPGTPRPLHIADLPDAEVVPAIQRLTGHRDPALEHPDLQALVLPALRADVEMHERHRPAARPPLRVPVVAIRGRRDPLVSARTAAGWRALTSAEFRMTEMDGGHMYVIEAWPRVVGLMESVLLAGEAVAA